MLALIATIVFCGAFLFFYREGNIFGIQYISKKEIIYASTSQDLSNLETIEVASSGFDVTVRVNPNVDKLMGAMRNKVFGYVHKSKAQAKFELIYNESTKTAVFKSAEPKGWLNKKDAYIEIAIPKSWADKGYNLTVKTNKGDIRIGGDHNLTVKSLAINAGKGEATVKNINITNALNLTTGRGTVYIDENCKTSGKINTKISVGSGTINLSKINVEKFNIGVVEVVKNVKGKIGILKAEELITNGNIDGGGSIEVGEIESINFTSKDTNISIAKIVRDGEGGDEAVIKITGQGKVRIKHAYCDCSSAEEHFKHFNISVEGYNGDIQLGKVEGSLSVITNQGDIKITDAIGLVAIESQYGNANIKFNSDADDYDDINQNRAVVATTQNGHIIVDGLQYGYIKAMGKGRISLKYDKVIGNNQIDAKSGVVNIAVPNPTSESADNEYAFNLTVDSEVNTDIKVGVAGSIGKVESDTRKDIFTNIYGTAGGNSLMVKSTTGIIKIRSKDLANF